MVLTGTSYLTVLQNYTEWIIHDDTNQIISKSLYKELTGYKQFELPKVKEDLSAKTQHYAVSRKQIHKIGQTNKLRPTSSTKNSLQAAQEKL